MVIYKKLFIYVNILARFVSLKNHFLAQSCVTLFYINDVS